MDVIDAEGGKRFLNGKLRGGFIASRLLLVHPTSLLRGKALSSLTYFQARATVYAETRRIHPHSQGSTGSKPTYEVETWMLGVHIVERK